jgi:hypothetical protein
MSVRKRKEIQEMLWRITLLCLPVLSISAAILPDTFAGYRRAAVTALTPDPAGLWAEYGLNAAEKASYAGSDRNFSITAYRMKDPTGAFAAFQWQRPPAAQSALTSATVPGGSLIVQDNYLLRFEGDTPHPSGLPELYKQLPQIARSSLPPLYGYLPARDRIPNSERYLQGNLALAQFAPAIGADLAAFDRGAEAQIARYRNAGSEFQLVLFSYPTPQMAMERARQFAALKGAAVRRSGPLLAVVPDGAGNAFAEGLVNQVTYNPKLTWNEEVIKHTPQDAAKMILAIATLAAGLIVSAVLLGILFGGSKVLAGRFGMAEAKEGFTTLHLDGK